MYSNSAMDLIQHRHHPSAPLTRKHILEMRFCSLVQLAAPESATNQQETIQ